MSAHHERTRTATPPVQPAATKGAVVAARQRATVFAWSVAAEFPCLIFLGWLGSIPVFELAAPQKTAA